MTDADVDARTSPRCCRPISIAKCGADRKRTSLSRHAAAVPADPGAKTVYARDDAHRAELIRDAFKGNAKVEVSRFKGLGEMMPAQLKDTTMKPGSRTLLRVGLADEDKAATENLVERLMGKKPELRFQFIQENAVFAAKEIDV